ncbi:GNAT family N-acetyltransferase [Isoptericola nanjingensis]|uniref:GNAT family N-acetyltransferase n=1 Tax=Isoptericola nanjingensis TaxID=903413 RepID=UPI003D216C6C
MTTKMPTVRHTSADEWREIRDLRLTALRDPAAPVAFLESYEEAAARPDDFWKVRARGNSTSEVVAGFVAVDEDGRWMGTVTGLVEEPGAMDVLGQPVERHQVQIVGVFVRPEDRGVGLLGRLIDGLLDWARGRGIERARMGVHVDNPRARAAYAKLGFTPSGLRFNSRAGRGARAGPGAVTGVCRRRWRARPPHRVAGLLQSGCGAPPYAVTFERRPEEHPVCPIAQAEAVLQN